jgi:hypothetical protein
MAGDWIKLRVDLHDDPAVICISARLDISEDEVVGKLARLWAWADRHTVDGKAPSITPAWIDRFLHMPGISDALVAVGWASFSADGIELPHFERHNGKSAKVRAEAAIRQRLSRQGRDTQPKQVTDVSHQKRDKSVTREEKRREEKEPPYIPPLRAVKGGKAANDPPPPLIKPAPPPPPPAKQTAAAARRARAKPLTRPFMLTRDMRAWAAEKVAGVDLKEETAKFVDHYIGNGKPMVDWVACWRNWMRNASTGRYSGGLVITPNGHDHESTDWVEGA